MGTPDLTKLTRMPDTALDSVTDGGTSELRRAAERYLSSFSWCGSIREGYEGIVAPPMVGVFLFSIDPIGHDAEPWLWVVVGDIPPAYLVTDDASTPDEALEAYIEEMRSWTNAVRLGLSTEDVIPVNAPPTTAFADMLETRLTMLQDFLEDAE